MPEHAESTDNRAYYDAFAERYDRDRDHGYHKLIDDQAAAIVRRYSADKDVLEVGCGTGLVLQRVAPHCRTAKGVDLSPGMLARARERGLDVQEGSATALPFADASFDRVLAVTVLCFVDDPARTLAEMARVTRPGGRVIVGELHRWSIWAARRKLAALLRGGLWRKVRFWSRRQLCALAENAGLRVREVRGAIFYPPSSWGARVGASIDPWLGRIDAPGAAFMVLAADRPAASPH